MAVRRPPRRVTREVPRWQRAARKRQPAPFWAQPQQDRPWWARRREPDPPVPVIQLSGRQAARAARDMSQAHQQLLAGQLAAVPGQPVPAAMPARLPRPGWRFRRHVQPFAWLALLLAAGAGLHAVRGAFWWGLLAGAAVPALMLLAACQRHKDKSYIFPLWTRRFVAAQAAATGLWLGLLAVAGPRACFPWVLLTGAPFLGLWVRHYRWRPAPAAAADVSPEGDQATWTALVAAQKWRATLGPRQELASGARTYPIQCDGISTVMKKILAVPDNVAGAWHRPVTECYVERDPKGVTSRGSLTILSGNSLQSTQYWDGEGMDPDTGTVRLGRFADNKPALAKWYEPRYGCYHDLVSGTTGSGKSELLNLYVFIALATGWFVPVILDPQEGQSLPFWQDKCIYARGAGQVARRIRGLHAGFLDRSRNLATMPWVNQSPAGPVPMPGMPFFDYRLTGLKIPLIIADEAHMFLKDGDKSQRQITAMVVELARLIRKAGGKLTLATQLPALKDLGGEQALRDMLRGGTVWSGRTANKVAGGMLGLEKDPCDIPRFFADGSKTAGLSYTDGYSNRPDAPMRTDRVPDSAYVSPPEVPVLDDRFLEVMDRAMKDSVSPTATVTPAGKPAPAKGGLMLVSSRKSDPEPELADDAPEGRRCIDAVWQVLAASVTPMDRGEVIVLTGKLAAEWGRDKPWSIKAVGMALRDLADGKVAGCPVDQPVKGGPYQAVTEHVSGA